MDPQKIDPLKNRSPPTNVKELQQFLGICNYYKKFVSHFSEICAPLYRLLKVDTKFIWGEEENNAFVKLKSALTSYPVLRQPNFNKQFILYTDASSYALGAILGQKDESKKEFVCAYGSRILKGAELHYGITEKECLAVIWAIKYFRVYLYGTKFIIYTDHSALTWLMKLKDPNGRLARWAAYIQAFDFEIIHRRGSANSNADALSRPVVSAMVTNEIDDDAYLSPKVLDPFEDDRLLHYLRFKRHVQGSSIKQIKRVEKLAKNFSIEYDMSGKEVLNFVRDIKVKNSKKLIVPPIQDREEIVKRAHLLAHFQVESTLRRVQESWYWKNMRETVERVVKLCSDCM